MARSRRQQAGGQQTDDGLPEDLRLYSPFPFKGINSKGSVIAIGDDEFAWLENVVWIGNGQLAFVPSNTDGLIYTAPPGRFIVSYYFYAINTQPPFPVPVNYAAVFLDDGSATQVNLGNLSQTVICAANVLSDVVSQPPAAALFGAQFLIIGTDTQYFVWDGTHLFGPGTIAPQIEITAGGKYVSTPTVTIAGGSGSGATAHAVIDATGAVVALFVDTPGSGYLSNEGGNLNVIFTGGGISNKLAQGTATIGGGGVTGVQITDGGTGYTNEPSITFSGGGASTQATAVAQGVANSITQVLMVTPGVGYTDTPAVTFGAPSGGGNTATGVASIGLNGITAITVTDAGAGYSSTPTVVITDPLGGGTGATAIAVMSGGTVASVTILNPGQNYLSAEVRFVGGNPEVATATAQLMPFGGQAPVSGAGIEVFKNRVWAVNNNYRYTSAPGSVSDFSAADGGVIAQNLDSFLAYKLYGVKQSSGFLYEFGDSSVNAISNPAISTSGSVSTTSYTVTNVDPQIGTIWSRTIQPFGEAIVFTSPLGIFAIYGSTLRKISEPLDDIFISLPNQPRPPTAAIFTLYSIKFYGLAIEIIDPFSHQPRQIVLLWDGFRWFAATQDRMPLSLATFDANGFYVAFGCNDTQIYECFSVFTSTTLEKKIISKFYGVEAAQQFKQAIRWYFTAETPLTYRVVIHAETQDLDLGSITYPDAAAGPNIDNAYGSRITVQGRDVPGASGRFLGWTLTSTDGAGMIDYMALAYRFYSAYYS